MTWHDFRNHLQVPVSHLFKRLSTRISTSVAIPYIVVIWFWAATCTLYQMGKCANHIIVLPWPKKRTILEIRGEKNAVPRVISCSITSDQRRARSDPRLSATFALRWDRSRVIEHDITRGTAFYSPRISKMVLFYGQGSIKLHGSLLACNSDIQGLTNWVANLCATWHRKSRFCPSCSISHKISKSDSSGGEPVICEQQQWRWACNLWFCATHNMGGLAPPPPPPPPGTNHQEHTNMSTANHSVSKYRKLEENNLVEHIKLIMGGWVGTTRFTHLDYREWSETTCTLAYIRRHVSSAWQPIS